MQTDNIGTEVRWSPRLPMWKLRRLYEDASKGIYDDELVDDVGLTLYLRCRDILIIHRAEVDREVTCPCCLRAGRTTIIARSDGLDALILCPVCDWRITWLAYRKTLRREQLNPGGAVASFQDFLHAYDCATSARARSIAIDRVVHQFHYSLRTDPDRPTRAAGVNLILGNLTEVVEFLDSLSGTELPSDMQQIHEEWRKKQALTHCP